MTHPLLAAARARLVARIADASLVRAALWLCGYTLATTLATGALYAALGGPAPAMEWLPTLTYSPVIETLMLGAVIIQMTKLHGAHKAIGLGASLMAGFHALNNLLWGLTGLGVFLLHAYAFVHLYHEDRQRAFMVPMLAHALHNVVALALLAAWRAW